MAQRVNISVPDDLFGKMQIFKDRLNISRICQGAIMRAIKLEEIKEKAMPDIENLAVRLRKEREDTGQVFKEEGFKDGIKDAYKMGFEEIYTLQLHQDAESPKELFDWYASKQTKEKVERQSHEEGEKIEADFGPFLGFDDIRDLYSRGWLDGVLHTWNQVKDKL